MQAILALFPTLDANQTAVFGISFALLYMLFFTMRDIFRRTDSIAYQILCILLVAALPVIGFLLYFLVRPARTVIQRRVDDMILSGAKPKGSDAFRL